MKKATREVLNKYSNLQKSDTDLRPSPQINSKTIIKKELHIFIKVFSLGLMSVFFYGLGVFNTTNDMKQLNTNEFHVQKIHLNKLERRIESIKFDNKDIANTKQKTLASEVEVRLRTHLDKRSRMEKDIIHNQKNQITNLQNKLEDIALYQSMKEQPKNKVAQYSFKNLQVLRYQQKLVEKKFKRNQDRKLKVFLSVVDLSTPFGKLKHSDYLDEQKVDLFEIRQKHQEVRDEFRKRKYRNLASVNQ